MHSVVKLLKSFVGRKAMLGVFSCCSYAFDAFSRLHLVSDVDTSCVYLKCVTLIQKKQHKFRCLPFIAFLSRSKSRYCHVTPHQSGDLHFYKTDEYHEGRQEEVSLHRYMP